MAMIWEKHLQTIFLDYQASTIIKIKRMSHDFSNFYSNNLLTTVRGKENPLTFMSSGKLELFCRLSSVVCQGTWLTMCVSLFGSLFSAFLLVSTSVFTLNRFHLVLCFLCPLSKIPLKNGLWSLRKMAAEWICFGHILAAYGSKITTNVASAGPSKEKHNVDSRLGARDELCDFVDPPSFSKA